jgi:hypothetical protein
MTPATVHLIAQDLRFLRGMLTAREEWVEKLPSSQATIDYAQRIEFWRDFLAEVEQRLAASGGDTGDPQRWVKDRHAGSRARPR